ncbi:MAG TPA: hypothetical protein VGW38_12255 [Chloroflexota bacterium]|nr:hypothetical protein [Chloroflexota bacterium]
MAQTRLRSPAAGFNTVTVTIPAVLLLGCVMAEQANALLKTAGGRALK